MIKIPPCLRTCKTQFSSCRESSFPRNECLTKTSFPTVRASEKSEFGFFVRAVRRGREVIEPENARRGFELDPIAFHRTPLIRRITRLDNDSRLSLTHGGGGGRFHSAAFPPGNGCATRVIGCAAYLHASLHQ